MSCCAKGLQLSNHWFAPDDYVRTRWGEGFYKRHPILARGVAIPVAMVSGFIKPFLFPLVTAVGTVAMPIIAMMKTCQGKKDAGDWLTAWGFCVLGVAGVAGFMALSAYHFPLIVSSAIFIGFVAISITIHVLRASQRPAPLS